MDVVVPAGMRGTRLDVALVELAVAPTRTAAIALLDDGLVTVDGRERPKGFRVAPGMTLAVAGAAAPAEDAVEDEVAVADDEPVEEPADPRDDVRIVYEDDAVLVVDKPAGLVTHPAKGTRGTTLVDVLRGHGIAGGADPDRPGVVHRLDRDTTGLLVLAKGDPIQRTLQAALRRRDVRREYRALVHGRPPARAGRIEAPIGRDPRDRTRMAVDGLVPREAVTHFALVEAIGPYSLLDLRLETGRTHQIRVHLEAIGHPVVGDPVYAPRSAGRLELERQFLHARRLAFAHPLTGEELDLESPLPPDLEAALARARAEAGPAA